MRERQGVDEAYRRPFNRPNRRVTSKLEGAVSYQCPLNLSERKESYIHKVLSACCAGPGTPHRLSERRVLIVDSPQVAPGGGVHLVIGVAGSAGRLGLQVAQAVGQFLR